MRGVPDIALQASSATGALVYITLPPDGQSGLICGSAPCSTGWYDIGGTSLSVARSGPALVAIADQINGGGLGLINPALYKIGADPGPLRQRLLRRHDRQQPGRPEHPGLPGARPAGIRSPASARRTRRTSCPTS